jgi:hypothetical protein
MKTVTIWEKLKLQIDNLEMLNKQKEKGNDVSKLAYWQIEYLNELLSGLEEHLGADKIRNAFL